MKLFLPKNGDRRFDYLAEKARDAGFSVLHASENEWVEKGVYFLPFSLNDADCIDTFSRIPRGSFVFVGKCSAKAREFAQKNGLFLMSLLENEYYLGQNAVHTAEGALSEIIAKTDRRLDQLTLLIYGYGNCGKAIAKLLWLVGCEVWVRSRERGQALATADGFNLYPAQKKGLGMFDGIINTVPDPIFSRDLLSTMQKGSFFFQIASGFSGIDPSDMKSVGIHFVPLHALPGKYCPASEADAIWHVAKETLINRSML